MKKIIFFVFLSWCFSINFSFSQSENDNLRKYWNYRDRLHRYFVKIGDETPSIPGGFSICAANREFNPTSPSSLPGQAPNAYAMRWGDAMAHHGDYMAVLALEYKLKKNEGGDLQAVLNELYYAINAINRLDKKAEPYLSQGSMTQNLNGFFIRDDVPNGFQNIWSNEYTNTQDPKDNVAIVDGDSYNTEWGTSTSFNQDNEMSQDQIIGVLVGLAFIKKCVDNVYVKPRSTDAGFYIHNEISAITNRIINKVKATYQWNEVHPCLGVGSYIHTYSTNWVAINPFTNDPVNSGTALDQFKPMAHAFCEAANFINGNNNFHAGTIFYEDENQTVLCPDIGFTVSEPLLISAWSSLPGLILNAANQQPVSIQCNWPLTNICEGLENFFNNVVQTVQDQALTDYNINMMLSLASISGTWTHQEVRDVANHFNMQVFDLVYAVIHDVAPLNSQSYYQNKLNSAPCGGPYFYSTSNHDPNWFANSIWNHPVPQTATGFVLGDFTGNDYMWLYNLYHNVFKNAGPLPKYEDVTCQCESAPKITLNSSGGHLLTPITLHRKFSDYLDLNIKIKEYSVEDLEIMPGGEMTVLTDLVVCNNSELRVSNSPGLIVGDGTIESTVTVRSGSALSLYPGGKLIIKDNSKVIIEPGALFVFENGASIELQGNNAVLEMQGNVSLGTNATLTFTGSGFIRWNVPFATNPVTNVTAAAGSRIILNGANRNDKVLEISKELGGAHCTMPANLNLFRVQNGKVEFQENTKLILPCRYHLVGSDFDAPNLVTPGGSIYVEGQTGMIISGSHFYNTSIKADLFIGGNLLKITSSEFHDFSSVKVDGVGVQLTNTDFENCPGGISTEDIYQPSFFNDGDMSECGEAMDHNYSTTTMSIKNANIICTTNTSTTWGILQHQGPLNLKCVTISGYANGIWLSQGGSLSSSTIASMGGYSSISGGDAGIYLDDAGMVNLDNGFNDLRTVNKIITGNFALPCQGNPYYIPANQNKWLQNNVTDPNTTGSPGNGSYPNALVNPTANGNCDVIVIDNNRTNPLSCGYFDPDPPSGTWPGSILLSCTSCPNIISSNFNDVRMDDAIQIALEKFGFADSNVTDTITEDSLAIVLFHEIMTSTTLDMNDANVAYLAKLSYQLTKTALQNCLNTGVLTRANNENRLHTLAEKYHELLNVLRQATTVDNYKEQFYLELDHALLYYWVGRYTDALNALDQIVICELTDREYRMLDYWKKSIALKNACFTKQISLMEYHLQKEKLSAPVISYQASIDPSATIHSSVIVGHGSTIGAGVSIAENVVIGENVTINENSSIEQNVVIADNVTLGESTFVGNGTRIGAHTTIGSTTVVSTNIIIGEHSRIGNSIAIARNGKIGGWVQIEDNASIFQLAQIGDGTYLGQNVIVKDRAKTGEHVIIRNSAVLSEDVEIGDKTIVGNATAVDQRTKIGKEVLVKENLLIGTDAKVCDGEIVSSNVPRNSILGSCTDPTVPARVFFIAYDEPFAVTHGYMYGTMKNGFKTYPEQKIYFTGDEITFDAEEYGDYVTWDFDGCAQSNLPMATNAFTNPGVYAITLSINPPAGCSASSPITYIGSISVYPKPMIETISAVGSCPSISPVEFNTTFTPSIEDPGACSSKHPITCTYAPLTDELCRLNLEYNYGNGFMEYEPLAFSSLSSGTNKNYVYPDGGQYNYTITGSYDVINVTTGEWEPTGYYATSSGEVLLNAISAGMEEESIICAMDEYTFSNTSLVPSSYSPVTYTWILNDQQTSTDFYPVFDLSVPGNYSLTFIIEDTLGCSDTVIFNFEVIDCGPNPRRGNKDEKAVSQETNLNVKLFPNPNSGQFLLEITEGSTENTNSFSIIIVDALNRVVYKKDEMEFGRTKIDLQALPSGVYHWRLDFRDQAMSQGGNFIISK